MYDMFNGGINSKEENEYGKKRRFKQIRSAFHPQSGPSSNNDKCYQLRYFIRSFNEKCRQIFNFGDKCAFDEGGVAMSIR